jgi:CubicO group peptidase (beta-lactamase class C family)
LSTSPIRPEVQRIVDRAFEEPNPARLRRTHAVVVVHDGDVVAERYARGVDREMPLPGWSMAKSVLNSLIGILVEEGRLSIDSRELLPPWRSPDARAAISIEDLLRMRSGLQFSEVYSNPWSDVLRMLFNVPDAAAYASSRPLSTPPGSVWNYASGTTNILSAVVRRTVGESAYPSWPRRALFDRLGMSSAVVEPDASGTFVFSSFMLATARDWARYGELWMNGGRCGGRAILSEEWIRFSTLPTAESPDGEYGAHWWLTLKPEIGGTDPRAAAIAKDAFFAVGHEGQTLTVIPSRRLVLVRLGASIYIDAWNQAEFVASLQDVL